ncbi:coiled-coil domain-containing protein 1-like [Helianthus annuus]|uniref:coiled-coil domain-containing protein 1-like n=1 Tax=Helianthus annuus TaxID=4232 RepID=UPI00165308B1|nr:coiled-coil domain-containing protein 1-like [Helianthus annuus]
MTVDKHKIVELRHLWDIPEDKNAEDLLEDVNLHRKDVEEEIVENVDVDGTIDDFIHDKLDDSDHSMEDFGSKSNLDDSDTDTDKPNDEMENDESDDDDW